MSGYFDTLKTGVTTILTGLGITWKHLLNATKRKGFAGIAEDHYFNQVDGLVTLQYPSEAVPTPSFARYRLHNEIDDCIGCDQCAKACPVKCITIGSFKATPDDIEILGTTSDGTKKRLWIPVFDIDMGKCMFCGLCTYPCPTECLTMTPVHDFTEFDREHLIYHFGNMTKEMEADKRKKLEQFEAEKKASDAAKPAAAAKPKTDVPTAAAGKKMSPMMAAKLAQKKSAEGGEQPADGGEKPKPKLSPALAARMAAAKKKQGGDAENEG
ncbi:4Fe-4S ferredoxin iron-sulfur binding domain protein [Chloroherpeton thalassium ATCC 35110]|uniref:4Fe-4S ferredoxin iron-sulfur binding domain protein n=1 Tax=Chloroherpeton thalassium (strain ATCC 35110 / GB-78) TaxID=517418 RepID=B3QY43_CHLT3|nr:4Fe-4S ferredoxin iron-sulfur binding domain protein [Chloroherpeton thalassium ATCC 35110]